MANRSSRPPTEAQRAALGARINKTGATVARLRREAEQREADRIREEQQAKRAAFYARQGLTPPTTGEAA